MQRGFASTVCGFGIGAILEQQDDDLELSVFNG